VDEPTAAVPRQATAADEAVTADEATAADEAADAGNDGGEVVEVVEVVEGDEAADAGVGGDGDEGDKAGAGLAAAGKTEGGEAGEIDEAEESNGADEGDGAAEGDEPDEAGVVYEEYEEYEVYESEESAEPQRARRWPRLLLVLGFIVLAAAIVAGAIAIVGSLTHGFKKPVKVTYKSSPVFSLKTGDCFDPQGQQSYTLVACDAPHQAEVFATFALTGTRWPGNAAVQAKASSGCAGRLTGYVNPQLAVSLTSTYVYPDSVAWQAGTRTVICEVRAADGELTGSVRGASASAG
jgi:hypothetical protein